MANLRKKKRKKRMPPDQVQFLDYIVEIDDWDWRYSFSIGDRRFNDDPFNEFRHIQINGKFLVPTDTKTSSVELHILPSADLNETNRKKLEPQAVGSLQINDNKITGLLSIPMDALTPLLQMLIAERFRFVVMRGGRFRYREALIRSLAFEMFVDIDDHELSDDAR